MDNFLKRFYHIIKDKKSVTLFTTLVNIKALAYYIFLTLFTPNTTATVVFTNWYFVATLILTILDLWLCWGFIHSCIKINPCNEYFRTKEAQSALETAKLLVELQDGNIVSSKIYSFNHVTQIEQESAKGDEIWCITGDLEEDSKNTDLGNIINTNLKKGVIYRYFITRIGETVSNKASWGEQRLREANSAYKKRLMFIKVDEELVAPDIDIIIYKANHINERIGFVCVEIGNDQNTYVYQQIDHITLQGICDKLKAYNITEEKPNIFTRFYQGIHKTISLFVRHLSFVYFFISAIVLAVLSFSKIVSWISAILFVAPALLEYLITIALIMKIRDSISIYEETLTETLNNEENMANIINNQSIKLVTEELKENMLNGLMDQKELGDANKIFQIDEKCSTIWLLSNLSHDIANQAFYDWLIEKLESYSKINCYILYPTGTATVGRTQKLTMLKEKYGERIKTYPLKNISAHYIWSETHGIIFFENIRKQHDVYISLGGGNDAFYKKVITTEEEAATLLGRLSNIADIEL